MSQPLPLSVSDLCYNTGNRRLLKDISFSLSPGELVGVIGPNGAGKSTLLKTLIGYHKPSHGQVHVYGQLTRQLKPQQQAKLLSYMAQHTTAAFAFSVRETIALGAHAHQLEQQRSNQEIDNEVSQLLDQLELEHLADRRLTELSGGESQMVHFARILMQKAPVMLLDEPTSSLDIGHEAQLMNLLRKQCSTNQNQPCSALVAIHNLNTAAAFCDRLLLLNDGEVLDTGTPTQVLQQTRIEQVYQHPVMIISDPSSAAITILPKRA